MPKENSIVVHDDSARAIRLPAETPVVEVEVTVEDATPRPTAEQVTKNELRLMEEAKEPPAPTQVLEAAPMLRPSLVAPVEVNGKMLGDFLEALLVVTPNEDDAPVPILTNARMSYADNRLVLEATDGRLWAIAKLKVVGGTDSFECILPLRRAINIVRSLEAHYQMVSLGVDNEYIHIGGYSLPHGGLLREFPPRPTLLPEELQAIIPARYIEEIVERLIVATGNDDERPELRSVHIDFEEGAAVATDGNRMHLLALGEMQVDGRSRLHAMPSVTLPIEFFEYLQLVCNRSWIGMKVNEKRVMVAGEDFGLIATPEQRDYPGWKKIMPHYTGYWVLDQAALLQALEEARPLKGEDFIKINVDPVTSGLVITAQTHTGERYQKTIPAKRNGGPLNLRLAIDPQLLFEAVDVVAGGLVRMSVAHERPEMNPVMVQGSDDEFVAVIMPCTSKESQ